MELNHEVVQDLYPLYIENELRPSVKQAVEQHLAQCKECKRCYESGEGFFDSLKDWEEPKVPATLDEKILLRIRLNRFKWFTLLLIGIILTMLLTDYKNEREKLFQAIEGYYATQEQLPSLLETVKNKEFSELEYIQETTNQLFENKIELEEHFNFIENRRLANTEYYLSMETTSFNKMIEIMQYRFDHGIWSETDEKAYVMIQEHFKNLNTLVKTDYTEMHHGYSSYFETINVEKLDQLYKKINLLSDSYIRFHKLPDQLHILNETTLKQRIAETLGISVSKVDLKKESPINYDSYTYQFTANHFSGTIDGLNGQFLEIHGEGSTLTNDPILNKEAADKKATQYIKKIYGKELDFDLVSLGFNYNYTSNDARFKVYSYRIVPVVKDYKLYTPFEQGIILHVDARTGELDMFDHDLNIPSIVGLQETDLTLEVDKESIQGARETVIIYSAISGKFELVYMDTSLEDFEEMKFYSTKTHNQEWIYSSSF